MKEATLDGLELTPEEKEGVRKYVEFLGAKARRRNLSRFYEEVDHRFPDIDEDTRVKLAESLYRKQMSEYALRRVNREG